MIYETYKDFDDLFLNINKNIIENPEKYINHKDSDDYYLNFCVFNILNYKANLDFSFLGYTYKKFNNLIRNYLDISKWKIFKEKLRNTTKCTLTFYFNEEKKDKGNSKENSPCILNMIFQRNNRKEKWNTIYIYYRTTLICRTFYVDLFLFYKMLNDVKDLCNIKNIYLIIPNGFFKILKSPWIVKYLNIDLDNSNYLKKEIKNFIDKYTIHPYHEYSTFKKTQEFLKGEYNYKPIDINNLELYEGENQCELLF